MRCEICGQDNPQAASFCANCGAALASTVKAPSAVQTTPAVVLATPVFAGFWIRVLAFLIDGVIVSAISGVASAFAFLPMTSRFPVANSFMFPLFPLLYWWLLTGLRGQTLGKMALHIKVVDQQGNTPGLGRAFLREVLGKFVSFYAIFLGFLWITRDREKQGWHDKIARTHVVRIKPR